jgi:rubrerythrin
VSDPADSGAAGDGSTAALFALAIESEDRARRVYTILGDRFAHVPEAAALFERMMQDEERHLGQLRSIRDALTSGQLAQPAAEGTLPRAKAVILAPVEDRLAAVRTLDDAYELAHELEHAEVNRVFAALANEFIPRAERRAFYLANLKEHAGRLADFASRHGGAEWRRGIRARGEDPQTAT